MSRGVKRARPCESGSRALARIERSRENYRLRLVREEVNKNKTPARVFFVWFSKCPASDVTHLIPQIDRQSAGLGVYADACVEYRRVTLREG